MTILVKSVAPLFRTCLGISMSIDSRQENLADAYDVLNQCVSTAIDAARDLVVADSDGQVSYKSPLSPLVPQQQPAPAAAGLSVLKDCGIPLVSQFGPFLEKLHDELSGESFPFVGFGSSSHYGRDTLAPLWSPPALLKLIPIDFGVLNGYYEHLNALTRLNPADAIWQKPNAAQWFNQFGAALKSYMTDLFTGQFLDRNGTAVSLDFNGLSPGEKSVDLKQVSPQLAGTIVTALVEYLGDQLFNVKLYSSGILSAYRDCRRSAAAAGATAGDLSTLSTAVATGSISERDSIRLLGLTTAQAKLLLMTGYQANGADPIPPWIVELQPGDPVPVTCDALKSNAGNLPLVRSGVARRILARIAELDSVYAGQIASAASSAGTVAAIKNQTSALQTSFTCFKAGVIVANLECIFIRDSSTGVQHGDCAADAGRCIEASGDDFDYADLVGRLVAFGATSAEKSVRSSVGGLIRGVAIAALQNEVIAEVVAALAGGLAKKYLEYATCTGIVNYVTTANGVDAQTKRESLLILAKYLGLVSG